MHIYDNDGNLARGIVNGVMTFYPGRHYNREVDGANVTVKKFYTLGSSTVAVRTVQGSNDTLNWILSDHLGSASVTANADGTWNSEIKYTAFGEVRASYGLTPTEYRYTGQLEQASINLYWYRSRWFDGELAHFIQADSLIPDPGDPLAWDRYAYGFNNPLNYNDPSGHWPEWGNVYDWIQGAIYQFSNDTSMGAVDKFALYYGKCMYCNVSDAYRQGQQAGRITSTVVGTVEQVGGAFTAGAGAAMIPPTLGGGAVCTGLTVGVCALPTGVALGLEAGMVAAGAGVYIHGTGVVAFAKSNPIKNPDLFGANGTQFTSKGLWQGEQGMLHAENPNPGIRSGQIHFQEYGPNGNKWYYDPVKNTFLTSKNGVLPPKWLLELINDKQFASAINKGLTALGE